MLLNECGGKGETMAGDKRREEEKRGGEERRGGESKSKAPSPCLLILHTEPLIPVTHHPDCSSLPPFIVLPRDPHLQAGRLRTKSRQT